MIDIKIPSEIDFRTSYTLNHPIHNKLWTWKYYDFPVMGVGVESKKFITVDKYIEPSNFSEIYLEIQRNKHIIDQHTRKVVVNGVIPKEHNNNIKSIDSYLLNQEKYINWNYAPDIQHLKTLSQIKSYFFKKFNLAEPWNGACHLREFHNTNFQSKHLPSNWLPHASGFPLLRKFVESLPFKSLGYAVFFVSLGDGINPVTMHRDTYHKPHQKSNFINILFDQKPRSFFVYDATTRTKHYLNEDCCMYIFNESDPHGVDAENEQRYMLRVEGIFEDWFAEKIGFKKHNDYYESFDFSYDLPKKCLKDLAIWQNTDI